MDSKENQEIIIKCDLPEMVKQFFKENVIIWYDPNFTNSSEKQGYIAQLKQFCEVLTFIEPKKAATVIQESKAVCHVIISGTDAEVFTEKIHQLDNVAKIYVLCTNPEDHSAWTPKYSEKISCVETDFQNIIYQFSLNLLDSQRGSSLLKVTLPAFAPIFNEADKSTMNHLHVYLQVIPTFENRAQAKDDLLSLSRQLYNDPNNVKLLAEFDKDYTGYSHSMILNWYTREAFLYKVTNNCLRIGTADSIQYCRLVLKDLEQAIKEQYQKTSKEFHGLLHRGAYLSQEEWASLKENKDKEIEMHGFLSVSKLKSVAVNFAKHSPSQKVLITIIVLKGPNPEEQGFAEIEKFSLYPMEKEVLFNVRSRFTVLETEEEYSPELPVRHLVLLYGARGLKRYSAERDPHITTTVPSDKLTCPHSRQEEFSFKPFSNQTYYCRKCAENSNDTAFLAVRSKFSTNKTIKVNGFVLQHSADKFKDIPFYGYSCSQCTLKEEKCYFLCTDCSLEQKTTYCEYCFSQTPCFQAGHAIVLETSPFSFWTQKMSPKDLYHLQFHESMTAVKMGKTFRQAVMFQESHHYDKAIQYFTLFLEKNPKDGQCAEALTRLGSTYSQQHNYKKALECHFKAIELKKSTPGTDPSGLAISYRSVGIEYTMLKDYSKALDFNIQALEIFKSLNKEYDIAMTYNTIGDLYMKQGEFNRAWEYFSKAEQIFVAVYGENNPFLISVSNYKGLICLDQKEYAKALEYLLKSADISRLLHGENDPSIALIYNNVASAYIKLQEYEKAVEYYTKALEIRKLLTGEKHPDIASSYVDISSAFKYHQKFERALEFCFKALDVRKNLYGENHPEIAFTYEAIGDTYLRQNELKKAHEYYGKALEMKRLFFEENSEDIAVSYLKVGQSFQYQGDFTKALECHWKSLEIRKTVFGENNSHVGISYDILADIYIKDKQYAKALECAKESLKIKKVIFRPDHPETIEVQNRIAELQALCSS